MASLRHNSEPKTHAEDADDYNASHEEAGVGTNAGSAEKDIALTIVGEQAQEIDPAVEARAVRKIDWFLIPAMIVGMYSRIKERFFWYLTRY